jgi:purine-binding chemotaxis protein CheW
MTEPTPTTDAALSPEEQAILDERAAALARSSEAETSGETTRLLVLDVGEERYGVDIQNVQEIEPLARLTSVPGTPAFWAGVTNLRGSMYPVLDLRSYLGLSGGGGGGRKVALVSAEGLSVGLLVDEVPEVREVPLSEIGAPVSESNTARADVVSGVTSDMLSVLDLGVLLGEPALVVEDEAA